MNRFAHIILVSTTILVEPCTKFFFWLIERVFLLYKIVFSTIYYLTQFILVQNHFKLGVSFYINKI